MGQRDNGQSSATGDASEARLRAFTGAIPLPMITVAMDGTIRRANEEAEHTLGVPPGGLPGRRVEDFAAEGEAGPHVFCQEMRERDFVRAEVQARRPDGRLLWLLASTRRFETGGDQRIVLVFEDVTELKEKERRLTEANEEAERNIRARMRFLAAASHDLRQPFQAMRLFRAALAPFLTDPRAEAVVSKLDEAMTAGEQLLKALLDVSTLEAGIISPKPIPVSAAELIERLGREVQPQVEARGLRMRILARPALVMTDPVLLERMLRNLLHNAVRYTERGGILIGARRRGDHLLFQVVDTGIGIPEEEQAKVFEDFYQVGNPGRDRSRGLGLGLSVVERMARLLGHTVSVRSVPDKGSVFSVAVRLAQNQTAAA